MNLGIRRLLARTVAVAAALSIGIPALATSARAETFGPKLPGFLTIMPSTGSDTTPIDIATPGLCPGGTRGQLRVFGHGFPASGQNVSPNNDLSIYPIDPTTGGYDIPFSDTMGSFAAQQVPPATLAGIYNIWMLCRPHLGTTDFGYFSGAINFTSKKHYVLAGGPSTAKLSLSAGAGTLGQTVKLTAAVTPANTAGSVKFFDGATLLGSAAPTKSVASLSTSSLAAGPHILTAEFTPTGGDKATSAPVTYRVSESAAVITLPVGTVVRTSPAAAWTRDGAVVSAHASAYILSAAQVGHIVATASGPAISVVLGGPLHAVVPPSLVGTGKVGTKLVLAPGAWSPAYTSRAVQWRVDGKPVAGAVGTFYVVRGANKGHKISALLTTHRAGYADGRAATAPVVGSATAKVKHVAIAGSLPAAVVGAVKVGAGLTVPVGTRIGCRAATFGNVVGKASWVINGKASAAGFLTIPDADYGKTIVCRTTAVVGEAATVLNAVVHVGPGTALRALVKPRVSGVAKAGKRLAAVPGKWTPVQTAVAYQWLLNGKAIKGATKATFVVPTADRHKSVSVKVTVSRKGWLPGTAVTAAVRIA